MSALFNASRARQYMRQFDIDALVATSATNVKYFSGYSCWLDPLFKEYMMSPGGSSNLLQRSYAVFADEGEPALIVKSLMAADAADFDHSELRLYGDPGLDFSLPADAGTETERRFVNFLRDAKRHQSGIEALAAVLQERGLADATIGIEMEGLPNELRRAVSQALPLARLRDCTNLIRLVRAVKTPAEVNLLARAAEIAEQAAAESLALAHIGGVARELVQHFRSGVAAAGAAFDHFSFSLSGLGICADLDYRFRPNDVLFIDYGCIFGSYFSDTGTALAFAELKPELARRYALLQSCIEAGTHAMCPGAKASSIQKAMQDVLREGGIVVSFPHGHGMGLEVRDYPILVPATGLPIRDDCVVLDSDLTMEEGMVNNLEAPLFMATAGALQIEKTFLVTADGNRELVYQDRSRPYIVA